MAVTTKLPSLQFLHRPPKARNTFLLLPKLTPSLPFSVLNPSVAGLRNFSRTRPLCSSLNYPPESLSSSGSSSSIVGDLLNYLNESWTQFHATAEAKRQLLAAGFNMINEQDQWDLKPGGCYFFTRNMSSLVAFVVGEKYRVGNGFHVIAAHTDSPCLKLKPKSASSKSGYLMVNVQTYGGGLWNTWFDRDLSVAGRVIVRGKDGSFLHQLVKIRRPLLRVPTLAIHLDKTVNTEGFMPNFETHLVPLLARKAENTHAEGKEKSVSSSKEAHHPLLLQILSEELRCGIDEIESIELNVCDTQPSCLGGANNEFIFSGRLDNLASCFCALRALIDSCGTPGCLANEDGIRMIALFDNEEVGSNSPQGAGAPTMFQAMRRIVGCLASYEHAGEGALERTIHRSFLVSADMAHGVHPNFAEKHEDHHRPQLQKGLVIKHNANQRYATSGVTSFLFKEIAKIHNLPLQEFVVRNDTGCGSTIGPILAAGVGIRTVDCGIPQLSMHSIREVCGTEDIDNAYKYFKAFYTTFSIIDTKLSVDS
ncbi:probable aspartyl aminopeptidase [Impatiens glandulifera]|uniref:probable aspartyl aminopeptidase n=1 Tax=Impatiens glandulifera TaxID=253017 RepID=UPI001FB154C8|nr:probable aspartyl aminopeptidase [Impatiens glandulifera]